MCNYLHCRTERKKDGYCVKCGEEICKDCASNDNSKVHAKCEVEVQAKEPEVKPSPSPKPIPRLYSQKLPI
jgi:hypothetical protein